MAAPTLPLGRFAPPGDGQGQYVTETVQGQRSDLDLTDGATGTAAADSLKPERTRTSSAWFTAGAGLVVALLMLIFVLQNEQRIALEFLWFGFELPVGATVLLSMVIGGLIVVAIGAGRVVQLRLAQRRHRTAHRKRTT